MLRNRRRTASPAAIQIFFGGDLERYRRATSETVRKAARKYLAFDRRVLLSIVPRGKDALALAGSERVAVS